MILAVIVPLLWTEMWVQVAFFSHTHAHITPPSVSPILAKFFESIMTTRARAWKGVSDLFFIRNSSTSDVRTCHSGIKRKNNKSFYQNRVSHVQTAHEDYSNDILIGKYLSEEQLDDFVRSKSGNYCCCLHLIIFGLISFSMFGKPVLRRHVKLKPIFTDAIIVCMIKLTEYEKTRS